MKIINGYDIYHAVLNGANNIKDHVKELNSINVFPVSDSDTGNNMLSTIRGVIDHAEESHKVNEVLNSMADGALIGARGNSGLIFAQFINGWYKSSKNKENLNEEEFINSLKLAVPYAYDSVNHPVQGTILTMIDQWTEYLERNIKDKTLNEVLESSVDFSEEVLEKTKDQLAVLKEANVVDSGAKGFYHFIVGIKEYFVNGITLEFNSEKIDIDLFEDKHLDEQTLSYRYCTEAYFEGENIDRDFIKNYIDELGDSSIIIGNDRKARVHVHTNTPELLFQTLYQNDYRILETKIDDMLFMTLDQKETKSDIALVTDSIGDIPEDLKEHYRIHVIPLNFYLDDNEFSDNLTLTPEFFHAEVQKLNEMPKSSIPSFSSVESTFNFLIDHYKKVLFISVSSQMSGMNALAKQVSKNISNEIYIYDSKLNSGAEGLLVLEAAKLIDEGKEIDEILLQLDRLRAKTKIYVAVDTFEYMVKGGRVPKPVGFLTDLINLKPIISIDEAGKGVAFGKSFNFDKSLDKILDLIEEKQKTNGIKSLAISHFRNLKGAEDLAQLLESKYAIQVDYICEVSNIVAANAGPKALAVSFIEE